MVTAQDYEISGIHIQAEIEADGTIRYVEERRYRFDGEYSYLHYTLPLNESDAVERIRVRQDGRALANDNSGAPGTFTVDSNDRELRITWFIEADEHSEHLYAIQYDLKEALTIGPDHAGWFRAFLSGRLDQTPESFSVRISLPGRIDDNEWHVWLRDSPDQIEVQTDGNLLFLLGEALPAHKEVRARILFPTRVLTAAGITDPFFELGQVIEDEALRAEALKREEQLRMLGIGLLIILIPGSLLIFIWFYRRYGRRHKPADTSPQVRYTPPSDHPPALIRFLMLGPLNREPDKLSLGITLFDLSRRGYFRIVERKGEKKFMGIETPHYKLEKTGKKAEGPLDEWEWALLDKVNKRIDEGVTRMDQVMDWSEKSTVKWWKKWRKQIKKALRKQEWVDTASQKAMLFHTMAQLPVFAGSIAVAILSGVSGWIGIVFVALMLILGLAIPRRTQEGVNLYARWSAYRKALKKGPNRSFDQTDINRHFVYAITLGLTKKQIKKRLSDVHEESPLFLWIVPLSGTSNPAEIAAGLSTLASSGTSSFSGVSRVRSTGTESATGEVNDR
ncbi:MAG: DUF2207 domain-containing protein [Balneolales bacterium]